MKGLDATQVEQLRQIAEYLSYQREQQGIPLEKIANQTYIPLRLLRALDSLQLEQLPEPVYIRGFIRRYADALGLDGMEIADAFPVESVIPEPVPDEVTEPIVEAQPAAYESHRADERVERSEQSAVPRPLLFAGIGAAVLIGAIALVALSFFRRPAVSPPQTTASQPELPTETAKTPAQSHSSSSAGSGSATPTPAPQATSPSSTSPSSTTDSPTSVQADVRLTDQSWVQVTADGKTAFEGTLDQGEERTWQARKKLVITAGNAGAVILSCNQGNPKPLGKAGEVVDATCPTAKKPASQTETQ